MKDFLKEKLVEAHSLKDEHTNWEYNEHIRKEGEDGWIHKVSTMCAIDNNKCDWVYIAIGINDSEDFEKRLIGILHFRKGENDDIGRVLKRALMLIGISHSVFEDILN